MSARETPDVQCLPPVTAVVRSTTMSPFDCLWMWAACGAWMFSQVMVAHTRPRSALRAEQGVAVPVGVAAGAQLGLEGGAGGDWRPASAGATSRPLARAAAAHAVKRDADEHGWYLLVVRHEVRV